MNESITTAGLGRERTSSPLNLVWNDVDPLGLDFDIRESALAETTHNLDSDLLKFGSGEVALPSSDLLPRADDGMVEDSGGKKRRRSQDPGRRTRVKKPSGKPKRPLTAKMCFFEELKAREQNERGTIDFQALRQTVEERWSVMGEGQRRFYERRALDDKNRFQEEMKIFTKAKPKTCSKRQQRKTPARLSPSPETTPSPNASGSPKRSSAQTSPRRSPFASSPINPDKGVPAHQAGQQVVPITYTTTRPVDYTQPTNVLAVHSAKSLGPLSHQTPAYPHPSPAEISPGQYVHHHYPIVDERLRAAPSMPACGPSHPRAPEPRVQHMPQRPKTEQAPALLRPKMEVMLNGPDGVARKYILHYKCISMKRDEVPSFMESLNAGRPGVGPPPERPAVAGVASIPTYAGGCVQYVYHH